MKNNLKIGIFYIVLIAVIIVATASLFMGKTQDKLLYSDIRDYSGPKFNVLYTSGFRFLITNGEQPYAEVNNTYVRQTRLMVTGNAMAWKSAQFTNLSLFDPNIILDMTNRKQVPN